MDDEETRVTPRSAAGDEGATPAPVGSRIAARFAGVGLDEDIPEQRGQPVNPWPDRGA